MPLDSAPPIETTPRLAVYDRVATLLCERGWCQLMAEDDGRLCLLGAFNVLRHRAVITDNDHAARRFARGLGFSALRDLVRWNDALNRRFDDVLARLDQAARGNFNEQG